MNVDDQGRFHVDSTLIFLLGSAWKLLKGFFQNSQEITYARFSLSMKLLALGEISLNFSNRSIIDHVDAEITTEVRLNKQLKLSLVLALS